MAATGESSIGTPVDPGLAATIRGGLCNRTFEYDNANPLECEDQDGCRAIMPNKEIIGQGNSGVTFKPCGAVFGCSRNFNYEAECILDTANTAILED
jgi:hypothetical protein